MTQSARRLTIFCLTMVIFALLFAELVKHNSGDNRRARLGADIACMQPGNPACTYAL